ncbi:MAG TPA: HutD family protein [Methylibium sp.]
MSGPQLIRVDAIKPEPWRNGGGSTRTLLAWPSAEHWDLRISVAEIAMDGPFSAYPDIERWFAVIEGAGVVLSSEGSNLALDPDSPPHRFDGASAPQCRLVDGATRDLNLMLRQDRLSGSLERAGSGVRWQSTAQLQGLYADDAGRLSDDAGRQWPLPARTLCWWQAAAGEPRSWRFESAAAHPLRAWWWQAAPTKEASR